MSAVVPYRGKARRLDPVASAVDQVTEEQVGDASRTARLLTTLLRAVAELSGRWAPQVIDFEGYPVDGTGTTVYRFTHKLGSNVRWYVVDWSGAAAGPGLVRHSSSDSNTLSLVSYAAGVVTIRVEVSG